MLLRSSKSKRYSVSFPKPLHLPTGGIGHQKRKRLKNLNSSMKLKRLRLQQKQVKDRQRKIREKSIAIELECEQLRKETNLVIKQSFDTYTRLAFMFQILKARENQEFDKAADLTCALRDLISREKQQRINA